MCYLNKIVGWVLSPLGAFFVGLGIAWGIRFCGVRVGDKSVRRVQFSNWIVGISLVVFWVMSCGITIRFVGTSLEREWAVEGSPHGDINGLPEADAIVVLGGGMGEHKKCGASEMFGSADRVWQGARLFKTGKAKRITLSGAGVEISTVPLLEDFGVPRNAVMCFPDARNTEEEAKLVYQKLRQETDGNVPKILLVTSAWHMCRAKLLFERAGFNVVPAPTDFEMSYILEKPIQFLDFLPTPDSLARNSYAIKEWVGYVGYRLFRR